MFEDLEPTPPPPDAVMMQLLFGKQITYSLAAMARLGVADHMGATPISIEALAEKVGAHTPSLYRVMRMLASVSVFRETGRQFALTPVGKLLRTDQKNSARYRAMLRGDEWTTRAYEHFVDCVRTGGDGVTMAYGKNIFELLTRRPDQADTFHRAMTDSSAVSGRAILEAYDFSGIGKLADVGGGHGSLLAAILRQYPQMQGVLYDLPEVLATVPPSQFAGCEGRIRIEPGSFFAHVPESCDAYLLKHIIHNWSDDDCRKILTLIREQLAADGRVLICEMVIQSNPGPSPAKMLDIEMLVMTVGGKERSPEEFRDVCASAGFCLGRIVPTPSPLCVVEAFRTDK
jgi:O-methyltransferase domain